MRQPTSLLLAGGLLASVVAIAVGVQVSPSSPSSQPARPRAASTTHVEGTRPHDTGRLTGSKAEAFARRFYILGANWTPATYRARALARRRMAAPSLARTLFADPPSEDYVRELREGQQRSQGQVLQAQTMAVIGHRYRVGLVVEERLSALGEDQPARRDAFQAIVQLVDGRPRIVEWSTLG